LSYGCGRKELHAATCEKGYWLLAAGYRKFRVNELVSHLVAINRNLLQLAGASGLSSFLAAHS
jgi:hypothetical protein